MNLLLPRDVAAGAARELDVLVPAEYLPDRLRLGAGRVPHLHREHHRIPARMVVEHRLDRRIGIDAAVPIRLPPGPRRPGYSSARPRVTPPRAAHRHTTG